ncbi:MAG: glycosyltransferase family 2 protein [Clostridia bacterium]|nr:glycosyltransferase family 2 protein [Clostridia bacterium]
MSLISVVVPCYNEEKALSFFYEEMSKVRKEMSKEKFELIFVDDGSKDKTLEILKELAEKDKDVKYISFSRNFGKEAAILAGFKAAKGDYVVMMDADLQDPPSLLPEMFKAVTEEGYDSVATRRVTRKGEPKIRSFFARTFYKLINKISDTDLVDGARDYRLMNRAFVDALLSMQETNRFSKGMFGWVGFKTKWIEFENVERVAGETKWSFGKLFKYALEGIIAFSDAPLKISSFTGFLLALLSVLGAITVGIFDIVGYYISGLVYLGIGITFLFSLLMIFIGILGLYVSKINAQVKKRPIFITKETNIKE